MSKCYAKPITLLTGFLGAGKTKLLNAYTAYKKNTRFAIVENEIGEEGIDGV
jgi:G3E family GTPase